jgi:HKD family nuclease
VPAKFILQGFTPQNHVSAFADVVQIDAVEVVLISVAFVSSAGVQLISEHIRPHSSKTTVFAGIRNGITSAQGIKELLDLGVALKTVDTGSTRVVFHPKLYYARGSRAARLLVGSANLTTGGLNNNIEASISLDLDISSDADRKMAQSIEKEFHELQGKYATNIRSVPVSTRLATLLSDPRLVDERVAPAMSISRLFGGSGALEPVPLIKLATKRIASTTKKTISSIPPIAAAPTPAPLPLTPSYELMWTTTELAERDLNIPKGKTTNATGSINLDKGAMEDGFDFRKYFREEVFDKLDWSELDKKNIETSQAHFHLIVEGIDCGEFILTVRHSVKLPEKSAKQNQPHTRISWGSAKPYVAKPALIGRTLRLSRATYDPTRFLIDID